MIEHNTYIPHGADYQSPTILVIHAMGEKIKSDNGGQPSHAVAFLNENGLSAHRLISPDGIVYKCRSYEEGAYHAKGFNANSIGIEFLVPGEHDYESFIEAIQNDWVTDIQYQAGLEVIKQILHDYPIARIVRHSDISPGRKRDPGDGFPWKRLLTDVGML